VTEVVGKFKNGGKLLFKLPGHHTGVDTGGGFIHRQREVISIHEVEQNSLRSGLRHQRLGSPGNAQENRVEEVFVHHFVPCPAKSLGKPCRLGSNGAGDSGETIGAVVDSKHSRHHGEKDLGGTNVARGFVSPDVLFPGLQSQAVGGVAIGVFGDADEAARHLALQPFANREIACMRSTKAQRNSKALRCPHSNIGAHFTRRDNQRHGQQIRGHNGQCLMGVKSLNGGARIHNASRGAGVLDKPTKALGEGALKISFHDFDSQWFRATSHDCFGLL